MKRTNQRGTLQAPVSSPCTFEGVVTHGDKRGRLLGFPTANLSGDEVPLDDGVWAGTVEILSERSGPAHVAAISLGRRPTYYSGKSERLIEAFLLDFDREIYGEVVKIHFYRCLRLQENFADSAQLVEQLHKDVSDVRTWAIRNSLLPKPPVPFRGGLRGWGPTERKRPKDKAAGARRDLRRRELISQAVLACPAESFSHGWVAAWTGLPEDYIRFHYPSLESLKDAAPHSRSE